LVLYDSPNRNIFVLINLSHLHIDVKIVLFISSCVAFKTFSYSNL